MCTLLICLVQTKISIESGKGLHARRLSNFSHPFEYGKPVREFHTDGQTNSVALRNDIDHHIDVALKMTLLEHQNGVRASYYILHDAGYMGSLNY